MKPLRLGTRASPLALWQAHHVTSLLRQAAPDRAVELIEIETRGDRDRATSLVVLGGQGVFTKAIQEAVLDGRADIAVHSLKDLPTVAFPGLQLAAVPVRGPTGDAFVSTRHASFDALPQGAVVASSSLRRRAQLLHRRPDLRVVDIRGNVETRLRKLGEQSLDATILAEAGLHRLKLDAHITEILDATWMLPAVGQGALGLECRADDANTACLLQALNHAPTHAAVLAERALLRELVGGCQVPLGARGFVEGDRLTLRGVVLAPDGSRRIEGSICGPALEGETLGTRLANQLRDQGANELLA